MQLMGNTAKSLNTSISSNNVKPTGTAQIRFPVMTANVMQANSQLLIMEATFNDIVLPF